MTSLLIRSFCTVSVSDPSCPELAVGARLCAVTRYVAAQASGTLQSIRMEELLGVIRRSLSRNSGTVTASRGKPKRSSQ